MDKSNTNFNHFVAVNFELYFPKPKKNEEHKSSSFKLKIFFWII